MPSYRLGCVGATSRYRFKLQAFRFTMNVSRVEYMHAFTGSAFIVGDEWLLNSEEDS